MVRYVLALLLLISPSLAQQRSAERAITVLVHTEVVLSWTASSTPNVTYDVYRSTVSGSGYVRIASGLTVLTYGDHPGPGTFYYVVTAQNSGGAESPRSNQVALSPSY